MQEVHSVQFDATTSRNAKSQAAQVLPGKDLASPGLR
jgi:hypothetical protein